MRPATEVQVFKWFFVDRTHGKYEHVFSFIGPDAGISGYSTQGDPVIKAIHARPYNVAIFIEGDLVPFMRTELVNKLAESFNMEEEEEEVE